MGEDTKGTRAALDALPSEAQRLFIARCVAFSCAFLERGESRFGESTMLAGLRRDFGADLRSFSEQLWDAFPQSDLAATLADRLGQVLDVQDDLPTGVDKLDGCAQDAIFIVLGACDWSRGKECASTIARMTRGLLRGVGVQEALAIAGKKTMKARDIDVSHWTDPEVQWQARYVDHAQSGDVEEVKKLAKGSAQNLNADLIPKINSAIVRSRT